MKHNNLSTDYTLPAGWEIVNDGAFSNDGDCTILEGECLKVDKKTIERVNKLDEFIASKPDDAESVVYCYSLINANDEFEDACQFIGTQSTEECNQLLKQMADNATARL